MTAFLQLAFIILSHVSLTALVFYACEQQIWTFVSPFITRKKESQNLCQTTFAKHIHSETGNAGKLQPVGLDIVIPKNAKMMGSEQFATQRFKLTLQT